MKFIINTLLLIVISITIINCSSQKLEAFNPKEIYKSNDLIVKQITENSFVHISFLQINDINFHNFG